MDPDHPSFYTLLQRVNFRPISCVSCLSGKGGKLGAGKRIFKYCRRVNIFRVTLGSALKIKLRDKKFSSEQITSLQQQAVARARGKVPLLIYERG
jgi:hypothetical protein